jgi:hypothetical protein
MLVEKGGFGHIHSQSCLAHVESITNSLAEQGSITDISCPVEGIFVPQCTAVQKLPADKPLLIDS